MDWAFNCASFEPHINKFQAKNICFYVGTKTTFENIKMLPRKLPLIKSKNTLLRHLKLSKKRSQSEYFRNDNFHNQPRLVLN